ncbi:MAG: hypothetical protein JWM58_49 [Rhizobium sp.]|nr:hypothetical protein [Rhizobium sp.]
MERDLLFHEATRAELRAARDSLLILPVGATEQHGPHLPTGTDFLFVETIARKAAAVAAQQIPVLVAPTLPFGCSQHHLPFGGTLSLSTEVYYRTIFDLAESAIISGFRKIFILNGHGGNHEIIQLVARDLALKHPASLAAGSYWDVAETELLGVGARSRGLMPGHAGAFETSLMLALRPDLVHEPRPVRPDSQDTAPAKYRSEFYGYWQNTDGYTDSPAAGTVANGDAYLSATVEAVGQAFVGFFHAANDKVDTRVDGSTPQ